jgi:dihydrofolate reductase
LFYKKENMNPFSLIAAVSLTGVIGDTRTNDMPWKLPSDLKFFKENTMGSSVIMGSKTFRSLGKPLVGRENVIITRNIHSEQSMSIFPHVHLLCNSVQLAIEELSQGERDIVVIGGGEIYTEAMFLGPQTLYITIVKLEPAGNVSFPLSGLLMLNMQSFQYDKHHYVKTSDSEWMTENGIDFKFVRFEKE